MNRLASPVALYAPFRPWRTSGEGRPACRWQLPTPRQTFARLEPLTRVIVDAGTHGLCLLSVHTARSIINASQLLAALRSKLSRPSKDDALQV
jgi:hypothetical protein